MRTFTLDEARSLLPEVRAAADRLIDTRARLVEATQAQQAGDASVGLADVKALEAATSDILDSLTALDLEVKGFAPLLVDFPMQIGDRIVLLCWLEGERDLEWYHDPAHGFAGRRPLAELDL